MLDKFAGVGLVNIFIIWLCCVVLSLMAKVILVKYHVDGLSEIVLTGA